CLLQAIYEQKKARKSADVTTKCPAMWKGGSCGKPITPQGRVIFIPAGINRVLEVGHYVRHVERHRPDAEKKLVQDIGKLNERFEELIDEQKKTNGRLIRMYEQVALKTG
ncbi:unnamed protein product, partial [Allacma fusca]